MKLRFVLFLALIPLMYACDCIQGEGELMTEKRDISGFNRINLDLSARVILSQDSNFSLMIEAQQNILDNLRTDVKGGELEIDFDEICLMSHEPITIFISMPEIKGLEVNSSGMIISKRPIKTDKIYFEVDGSGDIRVELKAEKVSAEIDGSGEIELAGACKSLKVEIDGSGDFYGLDLKSSDVEVSISGSGNCTVFALDELHAYINGSGDIRYKGDPDINTNISGSGSINKIKR